MVLIEVRLLSGQLLASLDVDRDTTVAAFRSRLAAAGVACANSSSLVQGRRSLEDDEELLGEAAGSLCPDAEPDGDSGASRGVLTVHLVREPPPAPEAPIVVDPGAFQVRAGFCGEDLPRSVFRTLPEPAPAAGAKEESACVPAPLGADAASSEAWWRRVFFDELMVDAAKHPVLLCEAPLSPKGERERAAAVLFSVFGSPAVYFSPQPTLALYACGRCTGLVADCGERASHACPVYEGYLLAHALQRVDVGGADLTAHMHQLLTTSGALRPSCSAFRSPEDLEVARLIKESLCVVPSRAGGGTPRADWDGGASPQDYELSGSDVITVSQERILCPEALLRPVLIGRRGPGLHEAIYQAICRCDPDLPVKVSLWNNIVLAGGTSLFQGLAARLTHELSSLLPMHLAVRVIAPHQSALGAWFGGSVLSSLDTFRDLWVTQAEYRTEGAALIHRRCY